MLPRLYGVLSSCRCSHSEALSSGAFSLLHPNIELSRASHYAPEGSDDHGHAPAYQDYTSSNATIPLSPEWLRCRFLSPTSRRCHFWRPLVASTKPRDITAFLKGFDGLRLKYRRCHSVKWRTSSWSLECFEKRPRWSKVWHAEPRDITTCSKGTTNS